MNTNGNTFARTTFIRLHNQQEVSTYVGSRVDGEQIGSWCFQHLEGALCNAEHTYAGANEDNRLISNIPCVLLYIC